MASLIYKIDGVEHELPVAKGVLTIGRGKGHEIRFRYNTTVSANHCQVTARSGSYYLMDLNSKNGTFLNDKRVYEKEALLKDGDRLKIGGELLLFRDPPKPAMAAATRVLNLLRGRRAK